MAAKKRPVPPALHELESEIMEEMWASGEVSVRAVMEALNRRAKPRAYTTFMTVMARLHGKGCSIVGVRVEPTFIGPFCRARSSLRLARAAVWRRSSSSSATLR